MRSAKRIKNCFRNGPHIPVLANWSTCHSVPYAFDPMPDSKRSNVFAKGLFPLFTEQLEKDFGIEDALQWYVVSHTTNTVELQILAASTALELLLSTSSTRMSGKTYEAKLASFLKTLNVRIDDLSITIAELSEARNKIVHTGLFKRGIGRESKREGVMVRDALDAILVRLFLAILGYRGKYFDPARGD